MTLQELIAKNDLDLSETIVSCEDFKGMLILFLETNPDISPIEALDIAQELINKGEYAIDTGNGTFSILRVVEWSALSDRDYSK